MIQNKLIGDEKPTNFKDFVEYGIGIFSFFKQLEKLMVLLTILTVFCFCNIGMYWHYGNSKVSNNLIDYIQLGNLGYSSSLCKNIEISIGKLTLDCPAGQISHIKSYGIIPSTAKFHNT